MLIMRGMGAGATAPLAPTASLTPISVGPAPSAVSVTVPGTGTWAGGTTVLPAGVGPTGPVGGGRDVTREGSSSREVARPGTADEILQVGEKAAKGLPWGKIALGLGAAGGLWWFFRRRSA